MSTTIKEFSTVIVNETKIHKLTIASPGPQGAAGIGKAIASTGWLSGGLITINADPTKFDVTSGTGIIVDDSNPGSITETTIIWGAEIAVVPTFIASGLATYIFVDVNGNIVQSLDFPTGSDLRNKIQIGSIVHPDNVNITGTSNFTSAPIFNLAATITDIQIALGVINELGNDYEGDPAGNLKFKKTAGHMVYAGLETKTDPQDPNHIDTLEAIAPNIIFVWKDGSGGWNSDVSDAITAGVYDDGTGGASVPNGVLSGGRWTNCRIHYSPDADKTVIYYGQTDYNSDTAALAAIHTEIAERNPELNGIPLRAIVTIRGGAADLTDVADAIFRNGNKFGEFF